MTHPSPALHPSSEASPAYKPNARTVTDHEDAFADAAMQAMDGGYEEVPHDE